MNKKIYLFCTMALALGFAACDNYEEPNPPAQSNPQLPVFNAENLAVTTPPATYDLKALNNSAQQIEMSTYAVTNFPESLYSIDFVCEISADASFNHAFEVPCTVEEGIIKVSPAAIQGVYHANISRSPEQATVYVRYIANAVRGKDVMRIGGRDAFYGTGTVQIVPFPAEKVIEPAYYLAGTASNGTIAQAIKLTHEGPNQYDDPVFSTLVEITADQAAEGFEWYIIPESTFAAGKITTDGTAFGPEVDQDSAEAGTLVGTVTDGLPHMGLLYEEGPHLVIVNMEEMTYKCFLAIDNLYTPGNSNGWSQTASQMLYTWNYTEYMGFAHLSGDFKFTSKPDWSGINYGAGEKDPAADPGTGTLSTEGGNINAGADGLYWCKVNISTLKYALTHIESCGCIGGFNGWGAQAPLTPSADFLTWTGTVHMTAGDEWKFRFNDNWDINLGGELGELNVDGANLKCEETGDYVVTLRLGTLPYQATVVKQ